MTSSKPASRRSLLIGSVVLLAGCQHREPPPSMSGVAPRRSEGYGLSSELEAHYGPRPLERFPVPEVDLEEVEVDYLRRVVRRPPGIPPGAIVISTSDRTLHLPIEGDMAIRYGVGVGKEGLDWSGDAIVGRKAEWPRWTPTPAMIAREPERNARWAGGMEGGLQNPLGARALYLHQNGRDTLYRIHGTTEPWSIGLSVSSGCIRMHNQDVIDLFNRTPVGTRVIVGA